MNCEICNKNFTPLASEVRRGKGKLCSRACCARKATWLRRPQEGDANPNWKGGINSREKGRRYRAKYPEKYTAHQLVTNAIRRGELSKEPCMVCETRLSVEAHHSDYQKPLDVIWLCKACHLETHNEVAFLS
jgi:hypothetical protein